MKIKNAILTFAAIGGLVLANAGQASATPVRSSSAAPVEAEAVRAVDPNVEQHCWSDDVSGESACADTQEQLAIDVLEDFNRVFVGEDVPVALTVPVAAEARSAEARATYILGVWYTEINYGGSSWTHSKDVANPCAAGTSFSYGDVDLLQNVQFAIFSWANTIDSFQTAGNCRFQFFVDEHFSGSSFGPAASTPDMGIFNNTASSLWVVAG